MPFRSFSLAALLLAGTAAFTVAAAAQQTPAAAPASAAHDVASGKPTYGAWGVDESNLDTSVKPGDDFFAYTNGGWLKRATIPADRVGVGYNYDLEDQATADVHTLVDKAAADPTTPVAHEVGNFYAAWMDAPGIEARGTAPLKPYLAKIDARTHPRRARRGHGRTRLRRPDQHRHFAPDDLDPTRYTVDASQARLGLPTRDDYLLPDAKYVAIRKAYRDYLIRLQTLAGMSDPAGGADRIIALETKLSQAQWTPEQRRDPHASYNPMDRAKLAALAPQFDWSAMLGHIGLADMPTVVVREPSAITAAGALLAATPLADWKRYVAVRFISDHAPMLPAAFDTANFDFYRKTLSGIPEQEPRWKRGVHLLDNDLGEAVGQLYVDTHWTPATSAAADELIKDMRAAYADKINHAAWMDAATRKAALAKLATFDPRVGHPAKYVDYSSMTISRSDPLANAVNANVFEWNLERSRLGKPVDRTLWDMNPQEVNAYYDPTMNQITFPAAILQPPFFDPNADPAVNYGEIGAAIGHEMGHGFDDEGRQYDAQGRLRDWWTKATADRYKVHADMLVKQFDAYEPIPGVHIKGRLTLGENLGDLGGLEAAYAAYQRYVARHGQPPVIEGSPATSASSSPTANHGKARNAKTRYASNSSATPTARKNTASTASCGTWMPGMRRST